jgi:hypothetical protein
MAMKVRTLAALLVAATAWLVALPAEAQFFGDRFGDRYYDQRPRRQQPQQRFFGNFFYDRDYYQHQYRPDIVRPAQPVDATKAPPPRKQDKPPTSTVV